MKDLRILFMGTPDFAVASLQALVEYGANIVAVVTMPDKPKGRHQDVLQPSAVKQYAVSQGLPVLQPVSLKDPVFLDELRALQIDLGVVVAFRMLPEVVWSMPRLGTFNLHAALLPQYRGAAPINWAIINGEKETGVTTFFLKHEIDTGNIIAQRATPITDDDNAETVHDRLMTMGAQLVVETVKDIADGRATSVPQPEQEVLLPAPKLFKENCRINWQQTGRAVFNFVRGLSPYPAAWTTLVEGDKRTDVKIFRTHFEPAIAHDAVGTVILSDSLAVVVSDGLLYIDELQVAGRKRMLTPDFLRGWHPASSQIVME